MMISAQRKKIPGNSGQAIVEFALVSMFFFALIFGVVEFGRYWYYSTHLSNSVRAAARYGAVLRDPATIVSSTETYAVARIDTYLPPAGLTSVATTILPSPNEGTYGETIVVSATYSFDVLAGTIIPGFSGTIPITRTASITYEGGS